MPIEMTGEYTRTHSKSPHLMLGRDIRLLAIFIEIWADHNWDRWESVLLAEDDQTKRSEGWNDSPAMRTLREWGVVDQHGVYELAGLSKRQTEIAYLAFDRRMRPREIARQLGCEPHTVRNHMWAIRGRLQKLAA